MSTIPFPQIIGSTYTLASVNAECQRCVNFFLEKVESGEGENDYYLRETPGLAEVVNVEAQYVQDTPGVSNNTPNHIQGMIACTNGRVFFVARNSLWELFLDMTIVRVSGLITNSDLNPYAYEVTLTENATCLWIQFNVVDLPAVYIDNEFLHAFLYDFEFATGLVNAQTGRYDAADLKYIGGKFINFIDNYLIAPVAVQGSTALQLQPSGLYVNIEVRQHLNQQVQFSPVNVGHGTDWDALDVYSVESSPDNIVAQIVNGNLVWTFGNNSYEIASTTTDPLLPFQRIPGAAFTIGCLAPNSVKSFQSKVFWLGSSKDGDGIVYMSEGYQARRISTIAIEQLIKGLSNKTNAYAWTYSLAGHEVYVLSFPSDKATYAYDLNTGFWHELSYRIPSTGVITQHRGRFQILAFGKNLVSDFETGTIYELSNEIYTDNGAPVIRCRRAPVASLGKSRVSFNKLELNMQTGVGLSGTGEGSDPKISMRFSDDNAHTWKNYYTRTIGKIGEYMKQVMFNRLGSTRNGRVFEIYCNEPVPIRIISAELDIEKGDD